MSKATHSQVDYSVPFDSDGLDWTVADNVHDAIIDASKDNFSYNLVASTKILVVPANQQMLVFDEFEVVGEAIINGEVVVL
jgi:hypothetical protein